MTELESYINSYFGISENEMQHLVSLFKPMVLNKEDYFSKDEGQCDKLSFIKLGHLRVFKYVEGKDVTQWISSKGEFVTDLSSLIFSTPARWNIQALTDCELYTISKTDYQKISEVVPQWEELEKLFLAKCFLTLEDRVFSFLSMSAEERYLHLFDYKKELLNQIPLHYLASMLGMTPETLSRVRRKF